MTNLTPNTRKGIESTTPGWKDTLKATSNQIPVRELKVCMGYGHNTTFSFQIPVRELKVASMAMNAVNHAAPNTRKGIERIT